MGRGNIGAGFRGMGRGSAGARLWGMGRGSAGARLRGMGRGNDAKTALGVIKETKRKIIKNREIFLSLENYSSKSICPRALWLAPLERELSKLV